MTDKQPRSMTQSEQKSNPPKSTSSYKNRHPLRKQYRAKYRRWKIRYEHVSKLRQELFEDLKRVAEKARQIKEENNLILDLMLDRNITVESAEDSDFDLDQNLDQPDDAEHSLSD